jgi:hypothetical protein
MMNIADRNVVDGMNRSIKGIGGPFIFIETVQGFLTNFDVEIAL